jgi:hypothetical protein|tara:strand:- start:2795 stop:3097 length:303 start_codon:yes stop_codon:yes gene_type:complete
MITEARVLLAIVVVLLSLAMWAIRRGIAQSEDRTAERVKEVTESLNKTIERQQGLEVKLPKEYASIDELQKIGKDVGVVKGLVEKHIGFHEGQQAARNES